MIAFQKWTSGTLHFAQLAFRAGKVLQEEGVGSLKDKVRNRLLLTYPRWYRAYNTLDENDRKAIKARIEGFQYTPKISVLMPVYNVPGKWLIKAIDSVRAQLYENWELCIADDCSTEMHVGSILKSYQKLDSRIKVVYREDNGHISKASNSALKLATGEFIALLDDDDELTEHALYMIVEELNAHPEADLVYSDEDKLSVWGNLNGPHFKPEFDPDLLCSYNLFTHLTVYRKSIVDEIGGFREGYEGSQDYDLALRFIEKSEPERIRHLPWILYHWRQVRGSTAFQADVKEYAHTAARKAIQDHLNRTGVKAKAAAGYKSFHRVIYALPERLPKVSVLIGARDALHLTERVVDDVLRKTDYENIEVILVDNRSEKPETLSYYEQISKDKRVCVLKHDAPFNFSAINNLAASKATGEYLCLLNNDIEVIEAQWLREMMRHACRPEVGIVGPKLLYPDNRIQHAGLILGIGEPKKGGGVAGHAHRGCPNDYPGQSRLLPMVIHQCSAVTAACMVLSKQLFYEVGGFDEKGLAVAFNDVDLCLRVREKRLRVIFTPDAVLYHKESSTRGLDTDEGKHPRIMQERARIIKRWGHVLANDPFYSPNLTIYREDYLLASPPRVKRPWKNSEDPNRTRQNDHLI